MPDDGGLPAYRFAVAPRFAPSRPWQGRFARNGGVTGGGDGAGLQPRDDWTALDDGALAVLIDEVPGRDAVLPPTHLGLLQVPERLRRAWWTHADRLGLPPPTGTGFEAVFADFVEFFRFKRLPLPAEVHVEVALNAPGLHSTRLARTGASAALAFGSDGRLPVGVVNLGDEASYLVVLELPPVTLVARLEAAGRREARSLAPSALVAEYLGAFPGQALLRVRLAPGEGLWLSPFGVVHDGWTAGKRDIDVMLSLGSVPPGPTPTV